MKRKKSLYIVIILIFVGIMCNSLSAYDGPQHGLIAKVQYSPLGNGAMYVPRTNPLLLLAADTELTENNEDTLLTNTNLFKVSAGYFYDFLQADFTYERIFISDQNLDFYATDTDGMFQSYEFRFGIRFNDPGDIGYQWIYIMGQYFTADIKYGNAEVAGLGYGLGFSTLHAFDISENLNFLLNFEIYAGVCPSIDMDLNFYFRREERVSLLAGASLGFGFHYEPYNISILLKVNGQYKTLGYEGRYYYYFNKDEFSAGMYCTTLGFEVIFYLYNYKYNR